MIKKVAFSSTAETVCEFTTEYARVLDALNALKPGDSAHLEEALNKVNDLVIDETGGFTLVHILLITDEFDNLRPDSSVHRLCAKLRNNRQLLRAAYVALGDEFDEKMISSSAPVLTDEMITDTSGYYASSFPFSFPNRFDVVCLADASTHHSAALKIEWESDRFKWKTLFDSLFKSNFN